MDIKNAFHTYCNPLPIPEIPRGKDDWYPYEPGMFSHENKPCDPCIFTDDDGRIYMYALEIPVSDRRSPGFLA